MDSDQRPLIAANLTVRHGDVVALNNVTVSVRAHERIALIGPSGAGKSTLLHTAAGLVTPTSGDITVLGSKLVDLRGSALRRHRRRVGLITQDLGLAPSLRVVHSVNGGRLGTWSTPRALASLARPSGKAEVANVLASVGLNSRVDDRTGDLSGGEQQRVAVARTLFQRPDIVLADEPTSSVDPELANQVMALICDRDAPWTVIVSVHDPALALRHADRIIALSNGTVAFDCPVADVEQANISRLYERR